MITRQQAWEILTTHMQNKNLLRHCLAVEAVMKALCLYFYENNKLSDEEKGRNTYTELAEVWGLVGLLHDGDYEVTKSNPSQHTLKMTQWLKELGETDAEILDAILSHNFAHTANNKPKNNLEWSLYCCDELTGLIAAVALVRPNKKLSAVTVDSVLKKFPQKAFAAGVHRDQIKLCEEKLGIELSKFVEITLTAMQGISDKLGL